MRNKHSGSKLSVRAISGNHSVIVAWDMKPEATPGLLGFAIERSEIKVGTVAEKFWLRGIKRFENKDKGVPAGTPLPTSEHPVQSFQWGDYSVKPGREYRYRVVPVYGQPLNLDLRIADSEEVSIHSEPEASGEHAIYFNRGVAGSQFYAREFPDPAPHAEQPDSPQMKWLSRGLFEALTAFIGRAKDSSWGLRAALYEFHYDPVGQAFKKAVDDGADVRILYDQPNYGPANVKMINKVKLTPNCQKRGAGGHQKHNKFIVLLRNGEPVEVWTGSTNISDGGIFGHSNVGHLVRSKTLAARYLEYWNTLAQAPDPSVDKVKDFNVVHTATPAGKPPRDTVTVLFSPRDGATLQWYADLMDTAEKVVCFTVAFSLAKPFENVIRKENDVLRYILSDKSLKGSELITRDEDVLYAAGAKFEKGDLPNFLAERLTGLNKNLYIHDKFMVIDPVGEDPTVITGSANFSGTSQTGNDENMLVIRSDHRVADIYFGEFMRIFDHLYSRYLAKKIREEQKARAQAAGGVKPKPKPKPGAGYLKPGDTWVAAHFGAGPKSKRRQYFHGAWET